VLHPALLDAVNIVHEPADFPYEAPVVRGPPELYERNMIDELALRLVHGELPVGG
jgi:hypothetical protein